MILDQIISHGLRVLEQYPEINTKIDSVIMGRSIYSLGADSVRELNYCRLHFARGYGFAHTWDDLSFYVNRLINRKLEDIVHEELPTYLKVALADGIYSLINNHEGKIKYKYLTGDIQEKAKKRAQTILKGIPKKSKVLLIATIPEIIEEAQRKELDLTVMNPMPGFMDLELDHSISRSELGTAIQGIQESDYTIATAMVFTNNTANLVFETAKKSQSKLIFFMETGSNFGQELLDYGVHRVVSEFYPFYDFYEKTKYCLFEKK